MSGLYKICLVYGIQTAINNNSLDQRTVNQIRFTVTFQIMYSLILNNDFHFVVDLKIN